MYKVTQCSGYLIWLLMGRWYYSNRTGPERSKMYKAWIRLNRTGDSGHNLCLILWSFSLLEMQIFFWLSEQLSHFQLRICLFGIRQTMIGEFYIKQPVYYPTCMCHLTVTSHEALSKSYKLLFGPEICKAQLYVYRKAVAADRQPG